MTAMHNSREERISKWHAKHAALPLATKLPLAWWTDYGFRRLYAIAGRTGVYTTFQNTESETPISVRIEGCTRAFRLAKKAESIEELLNPRQGG
jgi:hypothetical protein